MRLPNILTVSRVVLTLCFVFFITRTGLLPIVIAIVLFAVASFTDFYDGYYAKKHNLVSNFGKIMDPIADKFLILAAFYIFVRMHIVAAWMFYLIFIREVVITGSRFYAMGQGRVLAAEQAGKWKTVLQIAAIFAILGFLVVREAGTPWGATGRVLRAWSGGIDVLMILTVALTLFSGASYLWNNRKNFYPLL